MASLHRIEILKKLFLILANIRVSYVACILSLYLSSILWITDAPYSDLMANTSEMKKKGIEKLDHPYFLRLQLSAKQHAFKCFAIS